MTKAEAKRYAHRLVANSIVEDLLDGLPRESGLFQSPDWPQILKAIYAIQEQHARYGPKAHDKAPRPPEYTGEPLPYEGTVDLQKGTL